MDDLRKQYGSVRVFNGQNYVLDGTANEEATANGVADSNRRAGRKARVTRVGNRGILDAHFQRRKNCFAIWVCWE